MIEILTSMATWILWIIAAILIIGLGGFAIMLAVALVLTSYHSFFGCN